MTYKFPQFKVEIENPTISLDLNSIQDRALDKKLSIDVILQTNTSKFSIKAENMAYTTSWQDSDLENMVNNWLTQFEI
jgi:hypothetical protein